MNASIIKPFVEATNHVFNTMLNISPQFSKPHKTDYIPSDQYGDVAGLITMSGDVNGSVVLAFPKSTAEYVVASFVGMPMEYGGEDFADAIGELVNMVSGNAKSRFEDRDVSISIPSVVMGSSYQVVRPSESICISIPFKIEGGAFAVEVCFKKEGLQMESSEHEQKAAGELRASA